MHVRAWYGPSFYVIQCLLGHFLLGLAVGLLVCLSTWIIFRRRLGLWLRVASYILLLSLFLSLAVHVLEDYLFGIF